MRAPRTATCLALLLVLTLAACSGSGTEDGEDRVVEVVTSAVTEHPQRTPEAAPTSSPPTPAAPATPTAGPSDPVGATEPEGVVVDGDGFAITFPVQPSVETVDVPLEEGLSTQATIYQAQVDRTFLGFSHADTPDVGEVVEFDEEQALRDSAQGAADNTGGEVAEAEIVDFQGRTAIDYLVTVPGGVLRGIAFFDDVRLYTGQLVAEGDDVDRALLDEMMGSLVLS